MMSFNSTVFYKINIANILSKCRLSLEIINIFLGFFRFLTTTLSSLCPLLRSQFDHQLIRNISRCKCNARSPVARSRPARGHRVPSEPKLCYQSQCSGLSAASLLYGRPSEDQDPTAGRNTTFGWTSQQ